MAVEYPFGFIVGNTDPIDSRFRFTTLAARDALSVYNRYEGLTTYVDETETKYILKGGIANENWEEDGGGGSGVGGTDFLFVDTFEKAKIEDYTTTGTVALETVAPLHGLVSMKLEHPSSGYSQYGVTYPVQEKFKGKNAKLKFDIKSDATQDNVTIGITYDGGVIISDLAVNLDNSQPEFYFTIPPLANTLFYRVRALDETGKVTIIDDVSIEIVKDTTLIKYLAGDEFTDGSWRHRVDDLDDNALVLEKLVLGVWEEVRRSNF